MCIDCNGNRSVNCYLIKETKNYEMLKIFLGSKKNESFVSLFFFKEIQDLKALSTINNSPFWSLNIYHSLLYNQNYITWYQNIIPSFNRSFYLYCITLTLIIWTACCYTLFSQLSGCPGWTRHQSGLVSVPSYAAAVALPQLPSHLPPESFRFHWHSLSVPPTCLRQFNASLSPSYPI